MLEPTMQTEPATDVPEGYKTTDLGPLPEEWEVVSLEEVTIFTRKPRGLRYSDFTEIPFIAMEGIPADGTSGCDLKPKLGGSVSSGTYCEAGDVLLAKITPSLENGKQGIAPFALPDGFAVATTEVYPLKPKHGLLDAYFLFSYLRHQPIRRNLAAKMEGSTGRQRLPKHVLSNLLLPLPPLPEQKTIARVLHTVQQAKETTEQVIASARELKKGLMRHLFTYGPVPVEEAERVLLKETEIGPAPEHWQVMRLEETAKIERGKFAHRPRNDPRFYGGKTPFIQTGDVAKANGLVISYSQTLNELGLSVSRVFPKGTIVLTIAANIGDTGILAFDSAFPDSLVGITPKPFMDSTFLECYLQTQKVEMDRLASRGTQKNINIQFLKPWPILAPPLTEQKEIARILSTVDEKIAAEQNRKRTIEVLFETLLHNLMTGKLRVVSSREDEATGEVS